MNSAIELEMPVRFLVGSRIVSGEADICPSESSVKCTGLLS